MKKQSKSPTYPKAMHRLLSAMELPETQAALRQLRR